MCHLRHLTVRRTHRKWNHQEPPACGGKREKTQEIIDLESEGKQTASPGTSSSRQPYSWKKLQVTCTKSGRIFWCLIQCLLASGHEKGSHPKICKPFAVSNEAEAKINMRTSQSRLDMAHGPVDSNVAEEASSNSHHK